MSLLGPGGQPVGIQGRRCWDPLTRSIFQYSLPKVSISTSIKQK